MFSPDVREAVEKIQQALSDGSITRDDIRAIHQPHPDLDLMVRPWECLYTKGQAQTILKAWGMSGTLPTKGKVLRVDLRHTRGTYTHATVRWSTKKSPYNERLYEFTLEARDGRRKS